jgi:hypothetical protein
MQNAIDAQLAVAEPSDLPENVSGARSRRGDFIGLFAAPIRQLTGNHTTSGKSDFSAVARQTVTEWLDGSNAGVGNSSVTDNRVRVPKGEYAEIIWERTATPQRFHVARRWLPPSTRARAGHRVQAPRRSVAAERRAQGSGRWAGGSGGFLKDGIARV